MGTAKSASPASASPDALAAVDAISRDESARILATLIRACDGDFQLAEDALQEALLAAMQHWPRSGPPRDAAAWIYTTARRKVIDYRRREQTATQARDSLGRHLAIENLLAEETDDTWDEPAADDALPLDDRLRLIFTCCHPALSLEARVALTLRVVARLETSEIARAFLVAEATMEQRLVRAKRKIRNARIPYRIPDEADLPSRTGDVLAVLYLVFNAGYEAVAGDALVRTELCMEAIRLARLVHRLMPEEPEVEGLLALMLLHDARRGARLDEHQDLVPLAEQDRSRWDAGQIAEGLALVEAALRRHRPGAYQIQAAIAALHTEPETAAATDWRQIVVLYRELGRYVASPIVALNHAVAVAMVEGPAAGLLMLEEPALQHALGAYHLYHAARADLLRRAGRFDEAVSCYRGALDHCQNDVERRYLERRLASVQSLSAQGSTSTA